jgi:serine/threonine protein kinase
MALRRGTILETAFETYTVDGQLGSGGAGTVYSAADSDGNVHGIKVLNRDRATRSALKRFKNEIHFCSRDIQKNIIRVTDQGLTEASEPFYVMPLYSGSLRKLMRQRIDPAEVLPFFGQMLDGIQAAHLLGVWHRDLKPENVLHDDVSGILVIADFGIARFAKEDLLTAVETRNDERLANFVYAAPEQRVRNRDVSAAADVYALGLILNEMFTSEVPQGAGYRPISVVAQGFSYLDGIVEQMIQQDPAARHASISRIKQQLIARGNDFITEQKLSQLKKEVIPESDIDDPFVTNPIGIERVADYRDGSLLFELSAPPPPDWVMAFRNLGNYSAVKGSEPRTFTFRGKTAWVPIRTENTAQVVVNHAKNYVERANVTYREMLVRTQQRRVAEQREALRRKIEEEEHRTKVLGRIRL